MTWTEVMEDGLHKITRGATVGFTNKVISSMSGFRIINYNSLCLVGRIHNGSPRKGLLKYVEWAAVF